MSQYVSLRAKGLYTFANELSEIPEGSLIGALNIVIDRNGIIEPRRGFYQYGSGFGTSVSRANQILNYKNRLIVHNDSTLSYDSDGSGTFANFSGTYSEVESGKRIKYLEKNGNLYFTTSAGVKKISATSASNFTTSSGFITGAGGIKALDLTATPNYGTSGFLSDKSKVAYRVVWGITDSNSNLILGSPSSRVVVENSSDADTAVVDLSFPVPSDVTSTSYFYQIYRTGVFQAASISLLDQTDPGDEMYLVLEEFVTSSEITAGTVSTQDIYPEDLRSGGALLYTNPVSGEGIEQANEIPPFAKDISEYKGYVFYGNTTTVQRLNLAQLSVQDLISGTSTISVSDGVTTRTYTYRGAIETFTINFSGMTFPGGKANLDGKYFTITSANDLRTYKVWFDNTGSTSEPSVTGTIGIKVTITAVSDTATAVADSTISAINLLTSDFNMSNSSGVITCATSNNGNMTTAPTENISSGFVISTNGNGDGEDASIREVFLPRVPSTGENGPSVSQQIDQSARSLVKVINADTSGIVNAFYLSGSTDVPGLILLEQRDLTGAAFYVTANSTLTGNEFNPSVPTSGQTVISENESSPNRVYYSKYQQPEAVPLVNYIDVGPKDKEIQRIVSLRDSLFIFKEDGIYRLTGDSSPFSVTLFDSSAILQAPDSAVVLNNLVYAFSTQGIITVTDTGVNVISRSIEDKLLDITRDGYAFSTKSFGVAYETDRSYLLWTVSTSSDTYATQCYRYNSFTNTWTRWDVEATCGVVKSDEDKIYIGAPDINYIEKERKSRTRTDYADRQYSVSISENGVTSTSVELSSVSNVGVGDVLLQTQYLTIAQFNRLLNKLDTDSFLTDSDYYSTLYGQAGDQLSSKLSSLVTKLNADDDSIIIKTFTSAEVNTSTDVITVTAHGYNDGQIVYFENATPANLPGGVSAGTKYYIINSTTNTFKISTSSGGTAVDITSGGTGTHTVTSEYYSSGSSDFSTMQTEFNNISEQLGISSGVFFSSFPTSSGTVDKEGAIQSKNTTTNTVVLDSGYTYIAGPATIYKAISSKTTWAPVFFQDPTLLKHVRSGTILFENNNFSSATISYSSDLSPSYDSIAFSGAGVGDWGQFAWGSQNWGGVSAAKPLRTLIPLQKQRCRYLSPRFEHSAAFEKYSILGVSLTYRIFSERGYR